MSNSHERPLIGKSLKHIIATAKSGQCVFIRYLHATHPVFHVITIVSQLQNVYMLYRSCAMYQ